MSAITQSQRVEEIEFPSGGVKCRGDLYLPDGEGMFRFSTPAEAARALEVINGDYEKHCRAARRIAETFFDAKQVVNSVLSRALP